MTSTALYGNPKVGGDALAWCTRCKMDLAHVIVAMVDRHPKRVQCKTCRSEHNYKPAEGERPATSRASAKPRSVTPRTTVRAAEYWEQQMATVKGKPMLPYSVQSTYEKGAVINHTQFGIGIVEEVKNNGKMTVLFRDGDRTLVFGLVKNASPA